MASFRLQLILVLNFHRGFDYLIKNVLNNSFSTILLEIYSRPVKGYSHSHRACRNICDWNQNEIKGSTPQSRNVSKRGSSGSYKGKVKQNKYLKGFLLEYQVIKDLSRVSSSNKGNFLWIKNLDPSCKLLLL